MVASAVGQEPYRPLRRSGAGGGGGEKARNPDVAGAWKGDSRHGRCGGLGAPNVIGGDQGRGTRSPKGAGVCVWGIRNPGCF